MLKTGIQFFATTSYYIYWYLDGVKVADEKIASLANNQSPTISGTSVSVSTSSGNYTYDYGVEIESATVELAYDVIYDYLHVYAISKSSGGGWRCE